MPALDGVRGVAVAAVLLFHGGVSWARGGFLGVDAFFVLSGLLITSLLLEEDTQRGTIDLGHFWSRRARRLLPALIAVVAASGIYGAVLATPDALAGLRADALATLAYVANWRYIAADASYFEVTAQPSVLRHTWSLAIEEQFYLAWPLVMLAVVRTRARLAWTATVAVVGVAASVAVMWALFVPGRDPSRAYYGTDARAQVVLSGAVLAAAVAWARRSWPGGLGRGARLALGAAATGGVFVFLAAVATTDGDEPALFRGGFLVVAVAVAVVLADVVLVAEGTWSRILSWTPLRWIGLISYGLYLWHWPIYLTMTRERTGLSGPTLLGARIAITVAVAIVSYVVIEEPIRRGALPRWRVGLLLPAAVSLTIALVLAGTIAPATGPVTAVAAAAEAGALPAPLRPPRPTGSDARVLVVGDSVAKTLAQRLQPKARRYDLALTNAGVLGCGVVRGGPYRYFGDQRAALRACETWPQQWARLVDRVDPDVVLLIVGRWEVMDRVHNGDWSHLGQPSFDRYIESELDQAVRVLSAGDAIVAVTTAPYFLRGERADGGRWPEDDPARVNRFNRLLRRVVERYPERATVLELNERTSVGGRYTAEINDIPMRFDGVHFSPEGAAYLAPWLLETLSELAPAPGGGRARRTTTTATIRRPSSTTTTHDRESSSSTSTTEPSTTTTSEETTTTQPSTTLLPPRP